MIMNDQDTYCACCRAGNIDTPCHAMCFDNARDTLSAVPSKNHICFDGGSNGVKYEYFYTMDTHGRQIGCLL